MYRVKMEEEKYQVIMGRVVQEYKAAMATLQDSSILGLIVFGSMGAGLEDQHPPSDYPGRVSDLEVAPVIASSNKDSVMVRADRLLRKMEMGLMETIEMDFPLELGISSENQDELLAELEGVRMEGIHTAVGVIAYENSPLVQMVTQAALLNGVGVNYFLIT